MLQGFMFALGFEGLFPIWVKKFGLALCREEHFTQKQQSRFCGIWGLGRS
jgi:hypothetical protein